jgi:hypothetical protein
VVTFSLDTDDAVEDVVVVEVVEVVVAAAGAPSGGGVEDWARNPTLKVQVTQSAATTLRTSQLTLVLVILWVFGNRVSLFNVPRVCKSHAWSNRPAQIILSNKVKREKKRGPLPRVPRFRRSEAYSGIRNGT